MDDIDDDAIAWLGVQDALSPDGALHRRELVNATGASTGWKAGIRVLVSSGLLRRLDPGVGDERRFGTVTRRLAAVLGDAASACRRNPDRYVVGLVHKGLSLRLHASTFADLRTPTLVVELDEESDQAPVPLAPDDVLLGPWINPRPPRP